VFMGGTAVGAPIVGAICEAYGVRSGLVLGGASTLAAVAVLAVARVWRHRRNPVPAPTLVGRGAAS
jgi:predicted MFS family arabinose efflux permease